jgi:hypothetical protein
MMQSGTFGYMPRSGRSTAGTAASAIARSVRVAERPRRHKMALVVVAARLNRIR